MFASLRAPMVLDTERPPIVQKVKLFKSIESELTNMESEINAWIKSTGARLISVTGNIAPQSGAGSAPLGSFSASDVLIIVMYEEGHA
jgi:hypothetical protein